MNGFKIYVKQTLKNVLQIYFIIYNTSLKLIFVLLYSLFNSTKEKKGKKKHSQDSKGTHLVTAACSGVSPSSSGKSTSAFLSTKIFTMLRCPRMHAIYRAVCFPLAASSTLSCYLGYKIVMFIFRFPDCLHIVFV